MLVPFWPLVTLLMSLPAANAAGRIRRVLRIRPDHCATCGYNLTGNRSGICPECGAACKAAAPPAISPAAGS
jgi:predicted Zn-ribbon and HTH transcriptional regulator